MCRKSKAFFVVTVPLIAALAVLLFAWPSQLTYAKGVQKPQDSRESGSDRSSSNNSNESSSQSRQDNSSSRDNSNYRSDNSNGNSSHGNSSPGSNGSSGSSNGESSTYRSERSSESRQENSSGYRNDNSNESRKGNSSTYRAGNAERDEDGTRHSPPPSQSRRNDTPGYYRDTSNEPKRGNESQQNPIVRDTNESRNNNSTYRSNNSNTSSQQDDPRHKPPSTSRRETSNESQYRSERASPPPVTIEKQNPPASGGLKGYLTRSASTTRIQDRSGTRPASSPAGAFRKDYEDLGQIWKSRREKPDTSRDWDRDRDRNRDSNTRVNININFFPGHYHHYTYDYRPGFAYPSLYCYYYGLFPPYIYHHRVFYVRRVFPVVVFIEIPIYVFRDDYVYYDNYYSSEWRYRSLSSALRDIERAWERQDIDPLMDHVRHDQRIDISLKGEYAYSVDRQDYYEMTLDAMDNIRTVSFEFYNVRWYNGRDAIAYGKHVYYDDYDPDYGDRRTVYLKYRLEKSGDEWYITEVGNSPYELY